VAGGSGRQFQSLDFSALSRQQPAFMSLGVADFGFVEGATVQYDWRTAEGHPGRLPEIAEALVQARPAVVFQQLALGPRAQGHHNYYTRRVSHVW
jgi:hypothetical protein